MHAWRTGRRLDCLLRLADDDEVPDRRRARSSQALQPARVDDRIVAPESCRMCSRNVPRYSTFDRHLHRPEPDAGVPGREVVVPVRQHRRDAIAPARAEGGEAACHPRGTLDEVLVGEGPCSEATAISVPNRSARSARRDETPHSPVYCRDTSLPRLLRRRTGSPTRKAATRSSASSASAAIRRTISAAGSTSLIRPIPWPPIIIPVSMSPSSAPRRIAAPSIRIRSRCGVPSRRASAPRP